MVTWSSHCTVYPSVVCADRVIICKYTLKCRESATLPDEPRPTHITHEMRRADTCAPLVWLCIVIIISQLSILSQGFRPGTDGGGGPLLVLAQNKWSRSPLQTGETEYDRTITYSLSRSLLTMATVDYPIRIKNVISKMTQATQKALQDRQSRIEIEMVRAVRVESDL
jgi:hypothetical protein